MSPLLLDLVLIAQPISCHQTALIYSDYRLSDRTFLDTVLSGGWRLDHWNVVEVGRLMDALSQYDLLVFSPCYNFQPAPDHPYPAGLDPSEIARWVDTGGILVHYSVADDGAGDQWYLEMDGNLSWSLGPCDHDEVSDWSNPDAEFAPARFGASYRHFVSWAPDWVECSRCAHGNATTLYRHFGDGIIVVSVLPGGILDAGNADQLLSLTTGTVPRREMGMRPEYPKPPPSPSRVRADSLRAIGVSPGDEFVVGALGKSEKLTNRSLVDRPCKRICVEAAHGEWAGAQFAVVPTGDQATFVLDTSGFTGLDVELHPEQYLTFQDDMLFSEVLGNQAAFTVPDNVVAAAVWVSVHVPSDVRARTVRGSIIVRGLSQTRTIPVAVHIRDYSIPTEQHLPTDFALRPGLAWSYWKQTPWDQDGWWDHLTFERYAEWRRMLMQYRICPQGYMDAPNPSLASQMTSQLWVDADWDGVTVTPDWTRTDAFIQDMLDHGAPMVRVGYTGGPAVDTERWAFWRAWLPLLDQHVCDMGWQGKVYVYQQDEVRKEWWDDFLARAYDIQRLAPHIPRLTVLQSPFPAELEPATDIWCPPISTFGTNLGLVESLRGKDDQVWVYVCTSSAPPYSQLFMYEPGLNHRLLPWIIWKYDIQGLLYYGIAFWAQQYEFDGLQINEDGVLDQDWGCGKGSFSGGGCLMYPGGPTIEHQPQISLRLELLRQGLQDYERFWVLRHLLDEGNGTPRQRQRAGELLSIPSEIVAGCGSYADDEALLDSYVRKLSDAIEMLGGR